jgi:arginine utilization protein RocB
MDVFARNMPGWGKLYSLPTDALAELDIPVLNLGPLGRDAHKNTERIHLRYTLEVFPHLLAFLVKKIIEKSRRELKIFRPGPDVRMPAPYGAGICFFYSL